MNFAQKFSELENGQIHTAKFDGLQQLLPVEHRGDFNEDMGQCVNMTSVQQFLVTPEAVATNILPHFATFLSSLVIANLINYRPTGCPISLKIEVDGEGLATATIQWAYSMAGVENVQLPEPRAD